MLRHVLVPLDGSPLAEKALDAARRVLAPDGKITLLSSVEAMQRLEGSTDPAAECKRYLDHAATNLKLHGYHADVEIGTGDPAELIIERATTLGVEAIVMAIEGRSGLSRLLFGSVTLKILDETPCPVLIVPNREQVRVEDEAAEPSLGFDTLAAE